MRNISIDGAAAEVVSGVVIRTEAAVTLPVTIDGERIAVNVVVTIDPFTPGHRIATEELTAVAAQIAAAVNFVKRNLPQ